jgi:hypothetical protein
VKHPNYFAICDLHEGLTCATVEISFVPPKLYRFLGCLGSLAVLLLTIVLVAFESFKAMI